MGVVLDASVTAEYLINSDVGRGLAPVLNAESDWNIPHLGVLEVAAVFRSWVARGELDESRAAEAVDDLFRLPARRWPADPLLARIWSLRENVSIYDASYVALAETLDARLLTLDRRLARAVASSSDCDVVVCSP